MVCGKLFASIIQARDGNAILQIVSPMVEYSDIFAHTTYMHVAHAKYYVSYLSTKKKEKSAYARVFEEDEDSNGEKSPKKTETEGESASYRVKTDACEAVSSSRPAVFRAHGKIFPSKPLYDKNRRKCVFVSARGGGGGKSGEQERRKKK